MPTIHISPRAAIPQATAKHCTIAEFAERYQFTERLQMGISMMHASANYAPLNADLVFKGIAQFNDGHIHQCRINPQLKKSFGYAKMRFGDCWIEIAESNVLDPWLKDNKLENTFFHEIAHLMQIMMQQPMSHGASWRWIFNCFGFWPERCAGREASQKMRQFHVDPMEVAIKDIF